MFVLEETYLHFTQSQSVLKGISFSSGWILYHVSYLQLTIMPFLLPVLLLFTQDSDCRRLPQHTKTLVWNEGKKTVLFMEMRRCKFNDGCLKGNKYPWWLKLVDGSHA